MMGRSLQDRGEPTAPQATAGMPGVGHPPHGRPIDPRPSVQARGRVCDIPRAVLAEHGVCGAFEQVPIRLSPPGEHNRRDRLPRSPWEYKQVGRESPNR